MFHFSGRSINADDGAVKLKKEISNTSSAESKEKESKKKIVECNNY
jgi:hypothetical protein